jgi:predicted Ser/Thr protein kinase
MTTIQEQAQVLNEYGAWIEEKTLEGLNVSVEAYLEELEQEENATKLRAIEILAGVSDPDTFRAKTLFILGIKEAPNELD